MSEPAGQEHNTAIKVALIGAGATVLVAIISGLFALFINRPAPAPTPGPTAVPATATIPVAALSIEIDGPAEVPLGEQTFFTFLSQNAARAEWTIGGFAGSETFVVDPLPPSHQIYIEPTDAGRVGDSFTLVVTVYDTSGQTATARHEFQMVAGE